MLKIFRPAASVTALFAIALLLCVPAFGDAIQMDVSGDTAMEQSFDGILIDDAVIPLDVMGRHGSNSPDAAPVMSFLWPAHEQIGMPGDPELAGADSGTTEYVDTVVPEPGTLALVGSALILLSWTMRKRFCQRESH